MIDPAARILIVEDSLHIRQNLKKIFRELNFSQIYEAHNGQQALNLLREFQSQNQPIDLVFCDIWMPEMNGLDLLKEVRADDNIKETPFIMVTTESNKPVVIQAVMSGISGYIVKPFSRDDVRLKVEELFKRAKEEQIRSI